MIIELVLDALYSVFSILTIPINIPSLPDDIYQYLETAFEYINAGVGILANYTHINYLLVLFGIVIFTDVAKAVYHFVMWVIKKVPFLSIE